MRSLSVLFVACLLGSLAAAGQKPSRGPSTAVERVRALAAIGDLEQHPLGDKAQEERTWLLQWLVDVPDVSVLTCALVPGMGKAKGHAKGKAKGQTNSGASSSSGGGVTGNANGNAAGSAVGSPKVDSLILFQMMAGNARYAIEHKDEPVNPVAEFQAGVRSGLHAYEILAASNASNRQAGLEEMLQLRNAGLLDAWVEQRVGMVCLSAARQN